MSRSVAFFSVISASVVLSAATIGGCSKVTAGADSGALGDSGVDLGGASSGDAGLAGSMCDLDAGLPDGGTCHFQGTIQIVIEESVARPTQHADDLPATERYTFTALGDAYRWDLFEHSVARGDFRIYDRSAHRFYSVMQSQSTIFAVPESDKLLADPMAAFVLEDLHKTGRVAGWECELFRTTTPQAHYDICATGKLTPFPFQMMPGLMQKVVPFGAELVNRKLYPLLVNQYLDSPDAGAVPPPRNPKLKVAKHPLPDYSFHAVVIEAKVIDPVVFDLPKFPIQRIDLLQAGPKTKR